MKEIFEANIIILYKHVKLTIFTLIVQGRDLQLQSKPEWILGCLTALYTCTNLCTQSIWYTIDTV